MSITLFDNFAIVSKSEFIINLRFTISVIPQALTQLRFKYFLMLFIFIPPVGMNEISENGALRVFSVFIPPYGSEGKNFNR